MVQLDWRLLALAFVLALLLCLYLASLGRALLRGRVAKVRGARAMKGEEVAERVLQKAGYEIIDRQLSTYWHVACDDDELEFLLRADLHVRRDGQEYIAEVKTGDQAPSLSFAATRRQLLEYSLAFRSPCILLVDVEQETIYEIQFPTQESLDAMD